MADSMLTAAKKLATLSKLPWPNVQKVYRALQEGAPDGPAPEGWLPSHEWSGLFKSSGRAVWLAHPNFMARLLIPLAVGCEPARSRRYVEMFIFATENGEGSNHFETMLAQALTDEAAAADIESVEFWPNTARVKVNTKSRGPVMFWSDEEIMNRDGSTMPVGYPAPLLYQIGAIDGELIRTLQREIKWRPNEWPVGPDDRTEEGEDTNG